jgi:hypothetical protein
MQRAKRRGRQLQQLVRRPSLRLVQESRIRSVCLVGCMDKCEVPLDHLSLADALKLVANQWMLSVVVKAKVWNLVSVAKPEDAGQAERIGVAREVIGEDAAPRTFVKLGRVIPKIIDALESRRVHRDPDAPAARLFPFTNRDRQKDPHKSQIMLLGGQATEVVTHAELACRRERSPLLVSQGVDPVRPSVARF